MSDAPMSWAVIGGGVIGATIALRLSAVGHRVVLFEASAQLGGLASPWQIGDITWDRHYHVTLLSDSFTRGLLKTLQLEDEMRWIETKTGFCTKDRLVSMSNSIEYLMLPGLSLQDKLRIGATILYASRVEDWRKLEQLPVESWLVAVGGQSAFDHLWRPLLRAKLGDGYRRTSAAFIWATIQRLYAARRSGLKKEMFGYVPGGYARITKRLTEVLAKRSTLHLGQPVREVRTSGASGLEVTVGDKTMPFDRVTLTTTPRVAAKLCTQLSTDERERMERVEYQGIVCASVLLTQPLADYYLTYLTDGWVPFTAVIEMSAFVDRRELGGHALIYLPRYAHASEAVFDRSDESLKEEFLAALERLYPTFRKTHVLDFKVSRVREVFPFPRLGYSERLPPLMTSIPGLHLVSSAHIVNGTLNVNDSVRIAERAAKSLIFNRGQRVFLD